MYRSVTLRGEASRAQAWGTLMHAIYNSLIAATEEAMADVRRRNVVPD